MFEKIKSLFVKEKEVKLTHSELERRKKLNAELNHPDDNFLDDEYLEEEEMRIMVEKSTKKGNFRTGYYAFGFIFAAILMVVAVVNIFKTSTYDLMIMVQDDGFITAEETESLKELVKPFTPDKNEDGEIKIEVVNISLPVELTDANEGIYQTGIDTMAKEMVPYYISIVFGRENFINEAEEIRPFEDKVKLSEIEALEFSEESALNEYYIAVRSTEKKADKFSPVAQEIFQNIVK